MNKSRKLHIAFDPIYAHPLPEGHRFPMLKYELIPQQLLYEGVITGDALFSPQPCSDAVVLLAHCPDYVTKLKEQTLSAREQRRIGFPQSPQLTLREFVITQGTIDCCRHALENGVALNVAGGTHHAFRDRGEGFCLLNDFAVAATVLLQQNRAGKILIIDLDVHQGNGTAKIFEHEERVFTFSMHGKHNYPFVKEKSDLDVELPDGCTDDIYLEKLAAILPRLLETEKPDLAFFLSGVDVLETDRFGKLRVTMEGCRQRDRLVFSQLKAASVPCVVAMGGGYSPQVKTIVEAHCNTFKAAKEIFDLE
ncbi:histone deacetylase family protein [Flavisolibacter nicotianae]|uniref:histone deacetylase family protein n=1 Tax=Flavisolibacter nicotianae TaxID=2364882 RepID=UPI001F09E640|nr:histone deacetylase [Flavisolibacter nicotianae]